MLVLEYFVCCYRDTVVAIKSTSFAFRLHSLSEAIVFDLDRSGWWAFQHCQNVADTRSIDHEAQGTQCPDSPCGLRVNEVRYAWGQFLRSLYEWSHLGLVLGEGWGVVEVVIRQMLQETTGECVRSVQRERGAHT